MNNVIVIGTGVSPRDLTADHLEIIRSSDILMGGRRHLAAFDALSMRKEQIIGKVDDAIAFIRRHMENHRIVVLASGDPLFYGIGTRISRELGADRVTVWPNISSIAAAFARINVPWEYARVISLHGRDQRWDLLAALKTTAPVAVLTDHHRTPDWLAGWLTAKGVDHVQLAVFEQLGMPDEVFGWYSLEQAARKRFSQPNVVIIQRSLEPAGQSSDLHLGMGEDAFVHENGLITKSEIRTVALSKLALKPGQTLWDLGAGSGAVGIEASVLLGSGRIAAVEQKAERVDQIRANAKRWGVYNLDVIQSRLPDGLDTLPLPDRIFIGGGGRRLASIISTAAGYLASAGIMVVNTILLSSLSTAIDTLETGGLTVEVVQVQINRSKAMPWSQRLESQDPVWIIAGAKNE